MSYVLRGIIGNDYQRICCLSGEKLRPGDFVVNVTPGLVCDYAKFLDKIGYFQKLGGTTVVSRILMYIIPYHQDNFMMSNPAALAKFAETTIITRYGRITKKPLRMADEKFISGGSYASIVDQYDRGFDRGEFYDNEKGAGDLHRPCDTIYNEGDIVSDNEPIEVASDSEPEEEVWESGEETDEEDINDWMSSNDDDDEMSPAEDEAYDPLTAAFELE